ncbi:hypothetical protein ACHQM5_007932 [Ranunculus cassubicifolius]
MSIEDLDDWDSSFLEQAVQFEQEIISTSSRITQRPLNNFSPPRELSLSQQNPNPPPKSSSSSLFASAAPSTISTFNIHHQPPQIEDSEVDRLKRELRRVSQDLVLLEKECAELKKEKQKKDEELSEDVTILQDRIRGSRVQNASTSTPLVGQEYPVSEVGDYRRTSYAGKKSERATRDSSNALDRLEHPSSDHQLRGTYGPKGKNVQVNGISAATDLRRDILIDNAVRTSNECSIQNIDVPMTVAQPKYTNEIGVQTETDNDCGYSTGKHDPNSQDYLFNKLSAIWELPNSQRAGRSLVSKLSLLPIYNEMMPLDVLIHALLDLCTLDNVDVVHRSFCIMRVILQQLGWNGRSDKRDNVMVEGMHSKKKTEICKSPGVEWTSTLLGDFSSNSRPDTLFKDEHEDVVFLSTLDWMPLFDKIQEIAVGSKEECIQVEAISVMNLILMRSNPCLEREKFGSRLLFGNLSRLLHNDVALQVRKQAVHLLFLLLNCPKILVVFCVGCKGSASCEDGTKKDDALAFGSILEGLAECVKCRGQGLEEVKLRRLSIKVLAFIASSGKSGFEVILDPKISKGVSFVELIMQALASEMDADADAAEPSSETCKERSWLIREALILMNRIASNPAYSGAVLQVLTSSRDAMSLTIYVVNRMMSRKGSTSEWWKSDKKRKAEDEIVDLARVFRSRVFAYLGNTS